MYVYHVTLNYKRSTQFMIFAKNVEYVAYQQTCFALYNNFSYQEILLAGL